MKKKLLVIMLSVLCLSLYAQESAPPQEESTEQKQLNPIETLVDEYKYSLIDKEQLIEIYNENQELKKENESIQKALDISNQAFDRATNGYFWILSIIIGIGAILFGGNVIYQHFDRKTITKTITEEVLAQCMDEIKSINKRTEIEIDNRFSKINGKIESKTNDAIKQIQKIQLQLREEDFKKEQKEIDYSNVMNTALDIISLYFDLYQNTNTYDGNIISYIEFLIQCLEDGKKFWAWNIKKINELAEKCPSRLQDRFAIMRKNAKYETDRCI